MIIDESSAMLASVNFSKGNSVTVTAHAADLEGVPVSDQIVVFNTPPPTPSIALDALNRWCAIHYLGKESWNEEVSAAGSDSLSFTDALTVELWVWTAIQEDTDPIVLFAQSNVQNKSYQR